MAYKKKERRGFITMHKSRTMIDFLSDEDCGKLYKALLNYSEKGLTADFTGTLALVFKIMAEQIDYDKEVWTEKCERNTRNRNTTTTNDHSLPSSNEVDQNDQPNPNPNPIPIPNPNPIPKNNNIYTSAAKPRETEQLFNAFWEAYPKKKDKKNARKAFDKAIKHTDLDTMLAALEKQRTTSDWQRDSGQFIPYPATWLNGERWADDLTDSGMVAACTVLPDLIPDD